jgi:hypothetical protein
MSLVYKLNNKGLNPSICLTPLYELQIGEISLSFFTTNFEFEYMYYTTRLSCLLYADDLILLSESEKGLQSCLDSLNSYCNRWKLKINVTKTKVIVFSKGKRKLSQFNFTIDNQHIEAVEKYKYLGVILSYNDNLKHAAEHMCSRCEI